MSRANIDFMYTFITAIHFLLHRTGKIEVSYETVKIHFTELLVLFVFIGNSFDAHPLKVIMRE